MIRAEFGIIGRKPEREERSSQAADRSSDHVTDEPDDGSCIDPAGRVETLLLAPLETSAQQEELGDQAIRFARA